MAWSRWSFLFQRTHLFLKRSQNVYCTDRAAKNTPTHPAWLTVYARNVICKLSLRRQHKAKTITMFIVGKMMVECFERLQMALCTTTDGWCPTTPKLPRCLMHILTSRCPSVFRMSNIFLNTFIKVLTVLQQ
jgi:hypothetical protein